jgi:hypothetical protein
MIVVAGITRPLRLVGTCAAESILASGHVRQHRKAGHMEASRSDQPDSIFLQTGAVHIWTSLRKGAKSSEEALNGGPMP